MGNLKNAILEIPPVHVYSKGYRVTFEKLPPSSQYQMLPPEGVRRFEELYAKIQESPKKNLKSLKQLFKDFPNVPEIVNLLTYAYLKAKNKKEAECLIETAWRTHPDHFSARINYADQAIRLGRRDSVPSILGGCLDLHALYPSRDSFHYTEFRGFMVVVGFYYLACEETEKAEECYQLAFQVDPMHPSVAALEKKISKARNPSLLKKYWLTFLKKRRLYRT